METASVPHTKGTVLGEPLLIGVHDRLPIWGYVVYGVQMLIADGLTALVLPVVFGHALKLDDAQISKLLAASLLAAGLVCIGQSLIVLRLPVLQGPAIVFIAIFPLGVVSYGLAAMWTAMWIAALLVVALSWPVKILPKMRGLIAQPAVYGTFMVLVALPIGGVIFQQIVGTAGSKHYAAGPNYIIAVVPFLVALLVTVFLPRSRWRPIVLLMGAAIAIVIAAAFGRTDFSAVNAAAWLRVPDFTPFGFDFQIGAVLLVFAGYFVDLFEMIGIYKFFTEDVAGEKLTESRIAGGLVTEGIGSAIGGLFGGMGATTYAQNVGSIAVTRVGTRFQVTAAGVILVIMAFVGKFTAAIASLPSQVTGGLLFATVALLLVQGFRIVGTTIASPANLYAIGGGVLVGEGLASLPAAVFAAVPSGLRPFVGSPLIVGLAVAVAIRGLFASSDKRVSGGEAPADSLPEQAEDGASVV